MAISAVNNGQQTTVAKPAFKGSHKRTEQGNPYYHTNSAMKIGGTLAGISAVGLGINLALNNVGEKFINAARKDAGITAKIKGNKTSIILGSMISILGHLGAAAYIDSKRNQKAKELANYTNQVGAKNAVTNRDDIGISRNNRPYYESNVGAKCGGWLGAACGAVSASKLLYENNKAMKALEKEAGTAMKDLAGEGGKAIKSAVKVGNVVGAIAGIGVTALGGWLLGKWSDSIANNDAMKHA